MAQKPQPQKAKHYHVQGKDREYLTSNLSLLLKANVAVGDALDSLKKTSKSKALRSALDQMQADIDDGLPLWKALERSGVVTEQTLALVQLGEKSGNLAENLRVAALQEEKQRLFRSKVRSALMYPAFVLGLTVVVGIGVAWFLLPNLAQTFSQLHVELPAITTILIGFGTFLSENGVWAVPAGLGIAVLLVYIAFGAPKTKIIGQTILLHTPGVSRLMYEVEISRFGYLLGTLLDAGLSVTEALDMLGRATTIRRYKLFYAHLRGAFDNGYSFSAGFQQFKQSEKLLPAQVQQMVIAGERSGSLPETLKNIGTIYEEKSDASTRNLEALIEPLLLVVVWLGVLGLAVAVILPIYSLVGGLEQ
jgi:general secretion pathway protein F